MSERARAKVSLADLEIRLAYRFSDRSLAERALTHLSAAPSDLEGGRLESYQRLEFLGDRVLGLAVADMLYAAYPQASEGELSIRLAALVRRDACAEVAAFWDLGRHLRLGLGEVQTGGRKKTTILADVCEALIGAVFLDGGFV
ncbi:MAG TPA: ribonuclease III domain-containing protein, partial [Roseiarcus sp.]|nr:ribonuclease III domain-containing protein [Roseiarcus sp.]